MSPPLPPTIRIAALVGTAAATLWSYRLRARLAGASEADATRVLQDWSRRAWG